VGDVEVAWTLMHLWRVVEGQVLDALGFQGLIATPTMIARVVPRRRLAPPAVVRPMISPEREGGQEEPAGDGSSRKGQGGEEGRRSSDDVNRTTSREAHGCELLAARGSAGGVEASSKHGSAPGPDPERTSTDSGRWPPDRRSARFGAPSAEPGIRPTCPASGGTTESGAVWPSSAEANRVASHPTVPSGWSPWPGSNLKRQRSLGPRRRG